MQTPATAFLKARGIAFTEHTYEYVEHGGTAVYMERSIAALPAIYINGGRRGLLVKIRTQELVNALKPRLVEVALED